MIPKGTKIICPRKGHAVATTLNDVPPTGPVRMKDFEFEPGQERVAGEKMQCKLCGAPYFLHGKIFTVDGWKPDEPLLEPVTRK